MSRAVSSDSASLEIYIYFLCNKERDKKIFCFIACALLAQLLLRQEAGFGLFPRGYNEANIQFQWKLWKRWKKNKKRWEMLSGTFLGNLLQDLPDTVLSKKGFQCNCCYSFSSINTHTWAADVHKCTTQSKHTSFLQRCPRNWAHYKVLLCVVLAVASNNDVSLFREFTSRKSRYFSGVLELFQRGSAFFSFLDAQNIFKNGHKSFIGTISVTKKRHQVKLNVHVM